MEIKKIVVILFLLGGLSACSSGGGSDEYYSPDLLSSESPFGFHPASVSRQGYADNGYGDAGNIGVTWTRHGLYAFWFLVQPDLDRQEYDFSQYDREWSKAPNDLNILANIAPQGPVDEGRCLANSYFPVDEQKYLAFVKAVVQRYSSASYATAGLASPIKYWQVGNEPNGMKTGFADLQRITYTAIKEVCPDCTVLIGGATGMPPAADYLANFDQNYKPILDALAGNYVDVMDFHWYGSATGDYLGSKEVYGHIRALLEADGFPEIPMWITEMGAYSGDPQASPASVADLALQSEQQQALDYFKRFIYPLSFGVKKVFPAFGLMEGFKTDDGYFDYTGLIYDGAGNNDLGLGVKKLAYYTYKKMTEVLEGSDWNSIETIRATDNVYVFRVCRNKAELSSLSARTRLIPEGCNSPIYIAWWDYFAEADYAEGETKTISLTGVVGDTVLVTETVPNFTFGKDVTDFATAFANQTLTVANGTLSLSLGKNPVFVEVRP